jgi:DNA-binding CsgD family transcriptional regulator
VLDLVVKGLEDIADGSLCFEKDLTTRFLEGRTVELTPRESQLMPLVAQGLKNKEIAAALNIAEATVRIYLSALFRKLGVRDRYELAIYAMRSMPSAALQEQSDNGGAAAPLHRPLRSVLLGASNGDQSASSARPRLMRKLTTAAS